MEWEEDFEKEYLEHIKFVCLIMSENYIKNHLADIKKFANVVEKRIDDEGCRMENVLRDNARMLELCKKHQMEYILIDEQYSIDIDMGRWQNQ